MLIDMITSNLNSNLTQTCKESDFFCLANSIFVGLPFSKPKGFSYCTCVAIRSLAHPQKGCMEKKGCGAEAREIFYCLQ